MSARRNAKSLTTERDTMSIGVLSAVLYGAMYVLERAMSPIHGAAPLRTVTALYIAVNIGVLVCYGLVAALASRGGLASERGRLLAFGFPVIFSLALTIGRPYFSTDVFSYVAQGHQTVSGQNPYAQPLTALAGTPVGLALAREGWPAVHDVSPYGPLWTETEGAAALVSGDILTEALLLKIVVTGFALGSAVLVWLILGVVRPERQALATVLYLWNPVVITEFAGEGHNEAITIFFVLLSLYFCIRGRFADGVVSAAAGALIKIVALVIAPLELVYAWRASGRHRASALRNFATGVAVAAAIAAIAYAPLWIGSATFDGIRAHARPNLMSASTPGVLYWYLTDGYSDEAAATIAAVVMGIGFLTCLVVASARIRDAMTFLKACGFVAVAYLVLAPGYWPWYAATPIALLTLVPTETAISSIIALSLASRLAAPLDVLRVHGAIDWDQEIVATTIVGVWLPAAAVFAWTALRARAAGRLAPRFVRSWRSGIAVAEQ
jgi:hypothetical protein